MWVEDEIFKSIFITFMNVALQLDIGLLLIWLKVISLYIVDGIKYN